MRNYKFSGIVICIWVEKKFSYDRQSKTNQQLCEQNPMEVKKKHENVLISLLPGIMGFPSTNLKKRNKTKVNIKYQPYIVKKNEPCQQSIATIAKRIELCFELIPQSDIY